MRNAHPPTRAQLEGSIPALQAMPTVQLVWPRGRPWLGCAYVTTLIVARCRRGSDLLSRALAHGRGETLVCSCFMPRRAFRLTEIVGDRHVSGPPASRTLRTGKTHGRAVSQPGARQSRPNGTPAHRPGCDLRVREPEGAQGASMSMMSSRGRCVCVAATTTRQPTRPDHCRSPPRDSLWMIGEGQLALAPGWNL